MDQRRKKNMGEGKQYVVGRKPVMELLEDAPERVDVVNIRKGKVDAKIGAIVDLCSDNGIRYKFVDMVSMDRMVKETHQGVVAQVAALSYASFDTLLDTAMDAPLPLVLILDRVQDTGNVGALARSMYALGGAGIVVPQHETAYLGAGAVKASAGALNRLPVARAVNVTRAVQQFAERGYMTYATAHGEGALDVFQSQAKLHLPAVIVLGNEEKGVRPGVAKACGQLLTIPFAREFDSLNVAQAGAMLMALFASKK